MSFYFMLTVAIEVEYLGQHSHVLRGDGGDISYLPDRKTNDQRRVD